MFVATDSSHLRGAAKDSAQKCVREVSDNESTGRIMVQIFGANALGKSESNADEMEQHHESRIIKEVVKRAVPVLGTPTRR